MIGRAILRRRLPYPLISRRATASPPIFVSQFPVYLPHLSIIRPIATATPLAPLKFPISGFTELDKTEKIEEEDIPSYVAEDYYPVHIGEVLGGRYQIVTKLGYGVKSRGWLGLDLR
jgi:hypothetical protein